MEGFLSPQHVETVDAPTLLAPTVAGGKPALSPALPTERPDLYAREEPAVGPAGSFLASRPVVCPPLFSRSAVQIHSPTPPPPATPLTTGSKRSSRTTPPTNSQPSASLA